MLTIKYQTAFKKDYKRIVRRGYDVRLLEEVISILAEQKPLPEIYRDHNLSGDYIGCRECHGTLCTQYNPRTGCDPGRSPAAVFVPPKY